MAILKKATFQMDTNKSKMRILPRIPNDPGLPYSHHSTTRASGRSTCRPIGANYQERASDTYLINRIIPILV
jgi:hypothetical protein